VQVNVLQAKTQLSRLLAAAEAGEDVVIARDGKPVARLVPVEEPAVRRAPGTWRGRVRISDDFDAPLPDDVAAAFGAR
jgi:prevent-host-death family protein